MLPPCRIPRESPLFSPNRSSLRAGTPSASLLLCSHSPEHLVTASAQEVFSNEGKNSSGHRSCPRPGDMTSPQAIPTSVTGKERPRPPPTCPVKLACPRMWSTVWSSHHSLGAPLENSFAEQSSQSPGGDNCPGLPQSPAGSARLPACLPACLCHPLLLPGLRVQARAHTHTGPRLAPKPGSEAGLPAPSWPSGPGAVGLSDLLHENNSTGLLGPGWAWSRQAGALYN